MSPGDIIGDRAKEFHFAEFRQEDGHYLRDLYNRPLVESGEVCGVALNKEAFWHSSAHILGYAVELFYKEAQLTVGPATTDGFFYDFWLPQGQVVSQSHYSDLETLMKKIVKAKHRFERLELSKEHALDMFSDNPFKLRIINEKIDGETSVYKVGDFIDLCRGPHLPHSGLVKALKLMKNSAVQQESSGDAL